VALEEEFELGCNVGPRKINAFVAQNLFLHLGQFLLGQIDLSENERDLLRDERNVLMCMMLEKVMGWFRRSSEGVESKEVGGDDRENHENVNS